MPLGKAPSPCAAGSSGLALALPTRGVCPGFGAADGRNIQLLQKPFGRKQKSFQLLGSAKERMRPRPQTPLCWRR